MAWQGSGRTRSSGSQLPSNWPALRRAVLKRDGHRCQRCGAENANQVDHIERGDDHRAVNLQSLCTPCHALKSSREGVTARQGQTRTERRRHEQHPSRRASMGDGPNRRPAALR